MVCFQWGLPHLVFFLKKELTLGFISKEEILKVTEKISERKENILQEKEARRGGRVGLAAGGDAA